MYSDGVWSGSIQISEVLLYLVFCLLENAIAAFSECDVHVAQLVHGMLLDLLSS